MNSRNKWLWVIAALAMASPASAQAQDKRASVQGQLTCTDTPRLTISARPDGSDSGAVLGGTLVAIAGGPKADDSRLSTFTLGSHELPAQTETRWTGETSHTFRHTHLLLKTDFAVAQDRPYTDMAARMIRQAQRLAVKLCAKRAGQDAPVGAPFLLDAEWPRFSVRFSKLFLLAGKWAPAAFIDRRPNPPPVAQQELPKTTPPFPGFGFQPQAPQPSFPSPRARDNSI